MPPIVIRPASPFYNDSSISLPATSVERPRPADEVNPPTKITPIVARSTPAPEPKPSSRCSASTLAREFRVVAKTSSQRHASPYRKKVPFQHASVATCNLYSSDESLSELSELSDADSDGTASTLPDDSKIPKPQGEPGRPGRGGYTLQTALNWNSKAYTKLKKLTHSLIDEHLDTTKCASAQNATLLKLVRDKVTASFPDLENYQDSWPVIDLIMMRLKYTSSRARRREMEMAAGKSHGQHKHG